MKKAKMVIALLGCVMCLGSFTGCEEPVDEGSSVSVESVSDTVAEEQGDVSEDDEVVEKVVEQVVVDENENGNGISYEVVVP